MRNSQYTGTDKILEDRAATQLNSLKVNRQVLHVGGNNHTHQYRLWDNWLECRFSKETQNLGVLVDELHMSQKYALAAKADHILGWMWWSLATKMILHLDSDDSSSSLHEKYRTQFWSPLYMVNTATVEQVSWSTTKIVRGLEHMACKNSICWHYEG